MSPKIQIKKEVRKQMDEFLNSLSLVGPNEAMPPLRSVFELVAKDGDSSEALSAGIYQETQTQMGIGGYEKEMTKMLKDSGHSHTQDVITAITAIVLKVSGPTVSRIDQLEKLLAAITECKFLGYFVSALNTSGQETTDFLGIKIGRINGNRLSSRCRLAGSDFFHRYEKIYTGRLALEMPETKAKVIKISKTIGFRGQGNEVTKFLDNYHEKVAQDLMKELWNGIHELQVYAYPFEKEVIESENLMEFMGFYGHDHIYVFSDLRDSKTGWVGCYGRVLSVQIGSPQAAIHKFDQFQNDYNIAAVRRSSLASLIEAACHLQRSSMAHFRGNRVSDAALYACIVLELFFGEKENVAQKIAGRTAAILHKFLGKEFDDAKKTIERLYDKRSKFVHAGEKVSFEDCESIMEISKEAIRMVIRLAAYPEAQKEDFWEKWKSKADAYPLLLKAGDKTPDLFPPMGGKQK